MDAVKSNVRCVWRTHPSLCLESPDSSGFGLVLKVPICPGTSACVGVFKSPARPLKVMCEVCVNCSSFSAGWRAPGLKRSFSPQAHIVIFFLFLNGRPHRMKNVPCYYFTSLPIMVMKSITTVATLLEGG